jgi:nicotinamidase-related amidase
MTGNRSLTAQDCVLVLIDLQEKLLPVMAAQETVARNAARLVSFARIVDMPILACEQVKLGSTVEEISSQWEAVDPIPKSTFDCFGSEEFLGRLRELNRQTVVIVGIEAHICVTQTGLSALRKGFFPHVVMDATSARSEHNVSIARDRLLQSGATLTSTEMFIFECLKEAGTEAFKQTFPLIK